jgi:hypothetical protein
MPFDAEQRPDLFDLTDNREIARALPQTYRETWAFYVKLSEVDAEDWDWAEAWLGRHDLFYLLTVLLNRKDADREWLFDRCREVQKDPDDYLDLWSREHYKSTIITFALTIQDILNDPEITIGLFSHTRPIAKKFLGQVKGEFERNEHLKDLYPDVLWREPKKEAPTWSLDDGIVVKRKGNPKEATMEGWGLVDGQPTSKHYKLRIYDDVVTRENVTTPEQIEKTTEGWELSLNLGAEGGRERYIGTRYHLYDTYATMISRKAVKPRIYAATHNGCFDGRPVLFSKEYWEKKLRSTSKKTLAAQMLQNPMTDEDATFKALWLRSYELRPRTLNVYIMADPSRGRSATSDNTAIAVIGIGAGGSKFLLDGARHRMTLSQRWAYLRDFHKKWSRAPGVQHIAVGYERYGAQSDDEYFQERMQIEKYYFSIEELNWTRDGTESKRERVERLEPDCRNSRFYLPKPCWHSGAPSAWRVDTDPESKTFQDVLKEPITGPSKRIVDAVESGAGDLIAKALKKTNSDGQLYDLTLAFIDEFLSFPFGQFKDLVDATSRIYDMNPNAPSVLRQEDTEPPQFWDT